MSEKLSASLKKHEFAQAQFEMVVDYENRIIRVGKWQALDIYNDFRCPENVHHVKMAVLQANDINTDHIQEGLEAIYKKEEQLFNDDCFSADSQQEVDCIERIKKREIKEWLISTNQEMASLLGCKFNYRLRLASYNLWIRPVKAYCDKYCFYSNGRKHFYSKSQIKRLWENKSEVERLVADGIDHLAPLIIYFGCSPKDLKRKLGKSTWKTLTRNSLHKNKQIVRLLEIMIGDSKRVSSFAQFDQFLGVIKLIAGLKVTLIKNSYFKPDFFWAVGETMTSPGFIEGADRLAWLNKYSIVSDYQKLYDAVMLFRDTWRMSKKLGMPFDSNWSVRTMQERHDEYSRLLLKEDYSEENFSILSSFNKVVQCDSVKVRLLASPLAIAEEGAVMRHCVASYVDLVADGKYLVFSLSDDDGCRSTLGMSIINSADVRLNQHYGRYNSIVTSKDLLSAANTMVSNFAKLFIVKDVHVMA